MLTLRLYQVDAFTRRVFGGNPAAVCPLEGWPDDGTLQAIASENNLSETAFFSPEGDAFRLRWFAPRKEVSLCGHATLASAFVLFAELGYREEVVRFQTMSGELRVRRDGELLAMDFPAKRLEPAPDRAAALLDALHVAPSQVFAVVPGSTVVALYEDEETVRSIRPDFSRLAGLPGAVAITAPGRDSDCASRFFYPAAGLPEDPVTGSIHCSLVPYWAARLGKKAIHARQVSPRGGELFCEDRGERVIIAGHAVKYMEGTIALPMAVTWDS
jgi:PhzF family phenazine biosynthesis protein